MKNYERPIVMINEDLAEGVYAASGASVPVSTCYKVSGFGCQDPYAIVGTELNAWTVHVDGFHSVDAGHHSTYRVVTLTFNHSVKVVDWEEANTTVITGEGTTIVVSLNHHNNPNEPIGLSGLVVSVENSVTDLKVTGASIHGCNETCTC